MIEFSQSPRRLRVLTFDVECRPLAWYGGDLVTKQPTGIGWKEEGRKLEVRLLGESHEPDNLDQEEFEMLEDFREAYNKADIVTGHYIRGFDLPLLNGAFIRLGLPVLEDKLTQDTKMDFAKRHGMSLSQENLGAMFELNHPKIPMNNALWEEANKLTTRGLELTRRRVVGDVKQHVSLRKAMLEQGLLRPPQMWSSRSQGGTGKYHA